MTPSGSAKNNLFFCPPDAACAGRAKLLSGIRFYAMIHPGSRRENHDSGFKEINRIFKKIYEYTVDGAVRTKRIAFSGRKPPYTLYFYYTHTLGRALPEVDLGKTPFKTLIGIVPVPAYAVMTALGFELWGCAEKCREKFCKPGRSGKG